VFVEGWFRGLQVHVWSLATGTQAHLVLRDMILDGNSFHDGPRVDRNVGVPMGLVGMTVGNERFQTCFSYVFCGKEFQGQDGVFEYGSVTMIWGSKGAFQQPACCRGRWFKAGGGFGSTVWAVRELPGPSVR
jgi:hypothetical protein